MIPGKQYKPEDILEAAWRRRLVVVAPILLMALATLTISWLLPDRYRSEAVLLIVPQRVPETYVRATVTARLDERLQSINQQILTRSQLESIIQEFNLYPSERRRLMMEDVIQLMRKDIEIGRAGSRGDSGTFTVAFEAGDPRTAMLVTERLASLFIRQNLQDRSAFADQTDQFLESQLNDARVKLKEHETKLEQFKREHPGSMPEEMQQTQQALANAQAQLQALQESIYRDRDRQLMLQRMIDEASSTMAAVVQSGDPALPTSAQSSSRQLELARGALREMEMKLKPEHPDIRAQRRLIRDLEAKAAAEELQRPVSPTTRPANPAQAAYAAKIAELRAESDSIDRRLVTKQEDEKKLLAAVSSYRQRLESVPAVQSQQTDLMRDYSTLQLQYQTLLTKSQEAKMASNMERRQIGEQFKVIEPARMAIRPASPNRLRLNLVGVMFGIVLGVGFAGLLEYRDKSLRTEEDVVMTLALPVLAIVPRMRTPVERRKERRMKLVLASSGLLGVVGCAIVVAWKFRALAAWVR